MSSGCGDVLSLADLQTAKKHQLFEAEVITGLQGGVAGGASIDYATNQVTGQVQKTMPAVLRDIGFEPASFDFTTGGTLTVNDRNKVVYDPVSHTWYSWAGALPKTIPAGTDPLLDSNWTPQTDPSLRSDLASFTDGKGDALIGVKQPFTGSKGVTQHAYNARAVYVDDFTGTTGDGVTDDTAGFVAALTAAATATGNKILYLTPGKTYVLPEGVDVHLSDFVLSGYGAKIKYGPTTQTYNHCFRVSGNRIKIQGVSIECSSSLVRDNTGFGLLIDASNNVLLKDIELRNIASAGVWVRNSTYVHLRSVNNYNNKADGIHIADGTRNFSIIGCEANGCYDDSIAVVSDVPADGLYPTQGLVANNIVTNSQGGHSFVAIGCYSVTWVGNTAMGGAGPGFGSYFWQVTGTPADEDWVRDCAFIDNTVVSCGLSPVNESNATGFFVGALKNCLIKGNRIYGAPAFTSAGTNANCLLISNALNLTIENNHFNNSNEYGVYCRDANTSAAATFAGIWILNNTFNNIVYDAVHIYPSVTIGQVSMVGNTLINTPLNNSLARSSYIGKTGAALLTIANNINVHSMLPFGYDTATSTNISTYGNKPASSRGYTANLSGQGGVPTGSVTATYTRTGDMVFVDMVINVTAINGATNPTISLPFPAKNSGLLCAGRLDSVGGQMLQGVLDNANTLRLIKYDNTGTFAGLSGAVTLSAHVVYLASA